MSGTVGVVLGARWWIVIVGERRRCGWRGRVVFLGGKGGWSAVRSMNRRAFWGIGVEMEMLLWPRKKRKREMGKGKMMDKEDWHKPRISNMVGGRAKARRLFGGGRFIWLRPWEIRTYE